MIVKVKKRHWLRGDFTHGFRSEIIYKVRTNTRLHTPEYALPVSTAAQRGPSPVKGSFSGLLVVTSIMLSVGTLGAVVGV